MVSLPLLFRTIIHLKPVQLVYQVKNRIIRPPYKALSAPRDVLDKRERSLFLNTDPIPKWKSLEGETFSFLNIPHRFENWNFVEYGMLWAYNLNYFDWINQEGVSKEVSCVWIDRFIEDIPNNRIGLDPYPTALRSINWIKFFCRNYDCVTKSRLDSLYSQLVFLGKEIEYHLLGNHLLEDAFALYFGAVFFEDEPLLQKAERLLNDQLEEQVLPDGAHFEQSPMYHCILLDRLLDCINIRKSPAIVSYAKQMLGHLECLVWKDGSIPLMNDSAIGIGPTPTQIFDYAKRLGVKWKAIPMKESGYRKFVNSVIEAVIDVGGIVASYQPGHSHADVFNYELHIDGKPVVIDTGISTYNKTKRRQYERSTVAHNCVSVGGKDSIEVWGGFRVANRCRVKILRDEENLIEALHYGYSKPCCRSFKVESDAFIVEDKYDGEAISYIHLAPGIDHHRIKIDGAMSVDVIETKVSVEYNKFIDNQTLVIRFAGSCRYSIS